MNDPIAYPYTSESWTESVAAAAIEAATRHGAPPKVWHVGEGSAVTYGTGPNPFDGMTVTCWSAE